MDRNLKINLVRQKLKAGGICFGTMLRIFKSPQAIALSAASGWDYVILDTEHNDYDFETLSNCALVARYEPMSLFVRVPDKLYHQMARILDLGAEGLVLPQVKSAAEVEHIIRSTKYAPLGNRGVSVSSVATLYRDYDLRTYQQWANQENMNIIQIESEDAVHQAAHILSNPQVDAVMIGPADLSQDMGIPGQLEHPRMQAAFREVIYQCQQYGVAPGIHLSSLADVQLWVNEGMRFITYSYDSKFFKDASQQALKHLRSLKKG